MTTENVNLSNISGKEFNELLYTTFLKGTKEAYNKQKAEDMRRKTTILNAILNAAKEGKTSVIVRLDSCLSKRNEKFLKEANIKWVQNINRLGEALLGSPTEYAFYWEDLKNELNFGEED